MHPFLHPPASKNKNYENFIYAFRSKNDIIKTTAKALERGRIRKVPSFFSAFVYQMWEDSPHLINAPRVAQGFG